MLKGVPHCKKCHKALDRIDHYGIEHTILRNGEYGPVGIIDGGVNGEQYGTASEVDLRCAYCGEPIEHQHRVYFYKRWVDVKKAVASMGAKGGG